jgi:energy-coupling factor transporter ATP-binding protein EcfA2
MTRERITRLAATAFRGFPHRFEVDIDGGRSLIVFGENGTGKSTIADIVEFYMTGGIEFLAHEGRRHTIRHIGSPRETTTRVEVETTGMHTGTLEFPLPKGFAAPAATQMETFLLRGRTLAEFVDKSKSEKWSVLSKILGLEAVDILRLNLQTATNQLVKTAASASLEFDVACGALRERSVEPEEHSVLAAATKLCSAAKLAPPTTLEEMVSAEWLPGVRPEPRVSEVASISALAAELRGVQPYQPDLAALHAWNEFTAKEASSDEARIRFLSAAHLLLDRREPVETCPLCGQPIIAEDLKQLVTHTLADLQGSAAELEAAIRQLDALAIGVDRVQMQLTGYEKRAHVLGIALAELPSTPSGVIKRAHDTRQPLEVGVLQDFGSDTAAWTDKATTVIQAAGPTHQEEGENPLLRLGVLVEMARRWKACGERARHARRAAGTAERVFTLYQARQRQYFTAVLQQISSRAAEIYGKLHAGEDFEAVSVETMSDKGVELTVNFHGSKQKPPHGVLSESHLNSLAIALFLAMAQTFNDQLGFLVLDDVVNSFDLGHRGQLAELLAMEFKDWQLIVLTHDEQFYQRILRIGRDWNRLEFTSWTYEEGPRTTSYQTGDLLAAAREALGMHDRIGAAQKGRRALEEFLQELAEGIEAPLPYRRGAKNDRREIGELMRGLRRRLGEHRPSYAATFDALLALLDADVQAALNVESHSSVGRASDAEVQSALDRLSNLIDIWTCAKCGHRGWRLGGPEIYSCKCGALTYPPPPVRTDRGATAES